MLLLTREPFHLNFIQVYLQGGQSIFEDRPHQRIVFSSIRPVHVARTGFFATLQLQRDRETASTEVAV